ncbi:hypothetical protein E4U55_003864 [Claviceps digitariae]|nr:hypothetical protein E4U55_003864 [Claviceps digitariae]
MGTWHPDRAPQPDDLSRRNFGDFHDNLDDSKLEIETRYPLGGGPPNLAPTCSIGSLDLLPVELITATLLSLDLSSLSAFRQVNRRAKILVDSLYQYSMVLRHSPNVARAIHTVRADSYDYSMFLQMRKLRQERTLHLPNYVQARMSLVYSSSAAYLLAAALGATGQKKIVRGKLQSLLCVFYLPGRFTRDSQTSTKGVWLFTHAAVLEMAQGVYGMAVECTIPLYLKRKAQS